MKVRKNISLENDVIDKAEKRAKLMGFSFSAYLTYLINRDAAGELAVTEEKKPVEKPKKDIKISNAISSIMGD